MAELFSWEDAAGIDFATEVESVSRMFPYLDGLPSELTGDGLLGVAEQSAVCGGTSVALGAGETDVSPGSPADPLPSPGDQCLMSPSDALLASPDPSLASSPPGADLRSAGDWKVATRGGPRPEIAHSPAENAVADKITTLIEFLEPARAVSTKPQPAEEIFVSPCDLEMTANKFTDSTITKNITPLSFGAVSKEEASATFPVEVASPAVIETTGSPDEALSPEIELLPTPTEEDENTRVIDMGLEDLKTLESLCGLTSSDEAASSVASSASSASVTTTNATQTTSSSPASASASSTAAASAIKQEPVDNDDEDISIVEERPAPRRRRRRPPRVAVTPAAAPATQIVIVLTSEQLAGIQRSGQIVLNAASLQPSLQAAEALTAGGQKSQARGKAQAGKAQIAARSATAVKAHNGARSATVAKRPVSSTVTSATSVDTSTITGAASTITSASSTSGTKAVKRPQVIVKQQSAKRAKVAQRSSASVKGGYR